MNLNYGLQSTMFCHTNRVIGHYDFNATPLLLATNVNQMMHYLQFEPTINFFLVQILDKMI